MAQTDCHACLDYVGLAEVARLFLVGRLWINTSGVCVRVSTVLTAVIRCLKFRIPRFVVGVVVHYRNFISPPLFLYAPSTVHSL